MIIKYNSITFKEMSFLEIKKTILKDYKLACISRETSILGKKEVLNGKAKFGIFGDGKELPQIAMAKIFRNGDLRSGYYRDQTFMMAIGVLTVKAFFLQLYAHTNKKEEPSSSGRMMTSHFATKFLDDNGNWEKIIEKKNSSADISCSAGQLPRLLGLAQASKIYRKIRNLDKTHNIFSNKGNEVAFGTVGNASIAEGVFWEVINAAGVLQIPMILSIWDDNYGISVPNKYQFSKENITILLKGFQKEKKEKGLEIINVAGWNYEELIKTYIKAEKIARCKHIPVIIHVNELTQPQGHSTSGSHERYKDIDRLNWEKKYDSLKKFREWILKFNIKENDNLVKLVDIKDLIKIEIEAKKYVYEKQKEAWNLFKNPIYKMKNEALFLMKKLYKTDFKNKFLKIQIEKLKSSIEITKRCIFSTVRQSIYYSNNINNIHKNELIKWFNINHSKEKKNYSSNLYINYNKSSRRIKEITPTYDKNNFKYVDGRIILRNNFDKLLETYNELIIFGEDVGKIGDVNKGLEGLQLKYGKIRISDTGIREATILGQGIGLAMRGLRPIIEIQYIDYILYALYTMSDDLASLHYRTNGGQKAPVIIRTRGHRLEGIWHSGSPMGGLINFLRGILILVPRNMVKAAGFYNTLLMSDDPAIIVECLNGYRLKEKLPSNLGIVRTPIGKVEITKKGNDITVLTYGSTWKIVTEASYILTELKIDIEIIDIQSLIPFDIYYDVLKSIKKTHKLAIIDEDVPGGASAYLLKKILEDQNAYYELDSKPITITGKEHRPAYGSDGDYFSKPSVEDVIENLYLIMHEYSPKYYPFIFS